MIPETLSTPGQANYAAENAYLGSLVQRRIKNDKIGVSIVFFISSALATSPSTERSKKSGSAKVTTESMQNICASPLMPPCRHKRVQLGPPIIIDMDPAKFQKSIRASETTDGFWLQNKRFRTLLHSTQSPSPAASGGGSNALSHRQALKARPRGDFRFLSFRLWMPINLWKLYNLHRIWISSCLDIIIFRLHFTSAF